MVYKMQAAVWMVGSNMFVTTDFAQRLRLFDTKQYISVCIVMVWV
jgi:hypothetical protein